MLRLIGWALLASASLVFAPVAQSAQLGLYFGGSFGQSERDLTIDVFDNYFLNGFFPEVGFIPQSHTSSLDTKDTGYSALFGYRISRHLAVEGTFTDYGEVHYDAVTDGIFIEEPLTATTRVTGKMTGLGVHALGILPLSHRWEVYVRGGVQFTSPRLTAVIDGGALRFDTSSTTDILAGVGIAMSVMDIYGVRLEYNRVFDAGDNKSLESDLSMLSLGFIVAF
jgi:hypothetical protein